MYVLYVYYLCKPLKYLILFLGTALQNETIFLYRNGITHTDYAIDSINFVPKFLSDVNETLIAKAHEVCNGTGDQQCIYDYVVTLDTAVAVNTQEIQIQAEANDFEIGKLCCLLFMLNVQVNNSLYNEFWSTTWVEAVTRKCHNHRPQTYPQHHKVET